MSRVSFRKISPLVCHSFMILTCHGVVMACHGLSRGCYTSANLTVNEFFNGDFECYDQSIFKISIDQSIDLYDRAHP